MRILDRDLVLADISTRNGQGRTVDVHGALDVLPELPLSDAPAENVSATRDAMRASRSRVTSRRVRSSTGIGRKSGVDGGTRTLGLQNHNLAL